MGAAVAGFSGDDHSVAGYLVTEVLDRHSPELLDFLRKISTVDVVSAELANALTGRHDSARLLADLAASHLFVQAVGRPGRWYRLHRLLADILRAQPTTRRERRDLHRRATEWFRDHDRPLEAISSAIAGQLWPLAAEIVGVHLVALAHQGHARALERMLLAVPAVTLRAYPELTAGLAGARIIQGNRAGVTDLLTAARAATGRVQVRHPARARLLVNLAASGLARLDGNWEAAAAAHRAVPTDPAVVAGLGIAARRHPAGQRAQHPRHRGAVGGRAGQRRRTSAGRRADPAGRARARPAQRGRPPSAADHRTGRIERRRSVGSPGHFDRISSRLGAHRPGRGRLPRHGPHPA